MKDASYISAYVQKYLNVSFQFAKLTLQLSYSA